MLFGLAVPVLQTNVLLPSFTSKIAEGSSEMLEPTYKTTQRHIPEDDNPVSQFVE
jgi:hypothetical protein